MWLNLGYVGYMFRAFRLVGLVGKLFERKGFLLFDFGFYFVVVNYCYRC